MNLFSSYKNVYLPSTPASKASTSMVMSFFGYVLTAAALALALALAAVPASAFFSVPVAAFASVPAATFFSAPAETFASVPVAAALVSVPVDAAALVSVPAFAVAVPSAAASAKLTYYLIILLFTNSKTFYDKNNSYYLF